MIRYPGILLLVVSCFLHGKIALTQNSIVISSDSLAVSSKSISGYSFNYYYNKAEIEIQNKQYLVADALLDTARLIALAEKNEINTAKAFMQLGHVKQLIGDYDLSLEYFETAKNLFEKNKEFNLLTSCHVELAEMFRKITKFDFAHEHIQSAKELYAKYNLNDTVLLIRIYNRSAAINHESNPNILAMLSDSYKAMDLAKAINSDYYVAVSLNEIGYMYKNHLKFKSSDSCYTEAERLWMRSGHYENALFAMNNRAMLYLHNGYKKDEIVPLYKRIAFLADSLNIQFPLHDPYYFLYNHYLEKGDSGQALSYFIKSHEIDLRTANTVHNYNLHNLTTRYENKKIKDKYNQVKEKLTKSSHELETKRREMQYLVISVIALTGFISIICFLLYKIRKSNKILKEKNLEKDSLIQEIHHRVKNNLQFISSLINMQLKSSNSEDESKSLTEAGRRINAMALVHEMLYNQADQKGISAKYYLEELIETLYALVNSDHKKIDFELDITEINLNVSDTISIGIITSEIISNSMKHAFKDTTDPKVTVKLTQHNHNEFSYTIYDNGVGFKENKKGENKLGLRLVDIFSRQLKGVYNITGENGFAYTITFNKK